MADPGAKGTGTGGKILSGINAGLDVLGLLGLGPRSGGGSQGSTAQGAVDDASTILGVEVHYPKVTDRRCSWEQSDSVPNGIVDHTDTRTEQAVQLAICEVRFPGTPPRDFTRARNVIVGSVSEPYYREALRLQGLSGGMPTTTTVDQTFLDRASDILNLAKANGWDLTEILRQARTKYGQAFADLFESVFGQTIQEAIDGYTDDAAKSFLERYALPIGVGLAVLLLGAALIGRRR